jgi:hypothetical protein
VVSVNNGHLILALGTLHFLVGVDERVYCQDKHENGYPLSDKQKESEVTA